jgi:hypothetical protein
LAHLAQYKVLLLNTGHFASGVCISDGGTGTPDDPTDDLNFMDGWINEGDYKGLWLSGDGIACDFATATAGPKPNFLATTLATDLDDCSYRELSGHDYYEPCRDLKPKQGLADVWNYYRSFEVVHLRGSGCPETYNFDVIHYNGTGGGIGGNALLYDNTDVDFPPGYYASVDHVFPAANAPFDTVRTKIDGFTMHSLRGGSDCTPIVGVNPQGCNYTPAIAIWIRDVLGGTEFCDPICGVWAYRGYMYDRLLDIQYCPPYGTDSVSGIGEKPGPKYANTLFQNYPNPFRGGSGTTIHYSVAKAGRIVVRIFDVAGRLVNTIADQAAPGDNFVIWNGKASDGRSVASGVYFYQIKTDLFKAQKKMMKLD